MDSRLAFVVEDAAKPSDAANLYLFDLIGDPFAGMTSGQFIKELSKVRSSVINLVIDSPGGNVDDAVAMYSALKAHPAKVHGYVIGGAHSAASFVFQAADVRNVSKHASMTIHEGHGGIEGTAAQHRAAAEMLEAASQMIASIYAERAGGTVDEWRERMQANGGELGTTYIGEDIVANGLADAIGMPSFNFTPLKMVAQRVGQSSEAVEIDLALIPPLATGYKPPLPVDFTHLLKGNLKGA
jgi:ATP-dependent protease ClpP protease subunit